MFSHLHYFWLKEKKRKSFVETYMMHIWSHCNNKRFDELTRRLFNYLFLYFIIYFVRLTV